MNMLRHHLEKDSLIREMSFFNEIQVHFDIIVHANILCEYIVLYHSIGYNIMFYS